MALPPIIRGSGIDLPTVCREAAGHLASLEQISAQWNNRLGDIGAIEKEVKALDSALKLAKMESPITIRSFSIRASTFVTFWNSKTRAGTTRSPNPLTAIVSKIQSLIPKSYWEKPAEKKVAAAATPTPPPKSAAPLQPPPVAIAPTAAPAPPPAAAPKPVTGQSIVDDKTGGKVKIKVDRCEDISKTRGYSCYTVCLNGNLLRRPEQMGKKNPFLFEKSTKFSFAMEGSDFVKITEACADGSSRVYYAEIAGAQNGTCVFYTYLPREMSEQEAVKALSESPEGQEVRFAAYNRHGVAWITLDASKKAALFWMPPGQPVKRVEANMSTIPGGMFAQSKDWQLFFKANAKDGAINSEEATVINRNKFPIREIARVKPQDVKLEVKPLPDEEDEEVMSGGFNMMRYLGSTRFESGSTLMISPAGPPLRIDFAAECHREEDDEF